MKKAKQTTGRRKRGQQKTESPEAAEGRAARTPPRGSPLRPNESPTIEQLATLAASISSGGQFIEQQAGGLVGTAWALWVEARDRINEETARSEKYWDTLDGLESPEEEAERMRVLASKIGASALLSKEVASWNEVAKAFYPALSAAKRDSRLESLVASALVGKGYYRTWTCESFREFGFKGGPWALRQLLEVRASEKMRELRSKRDNKK